MGRTIFFLGISATSVENFPEDWVWQELMVRDLVIRGRLCLIGTRLGLDC